MIMQKTDFVAQLQLLGSELGKAIANKDFERVKFIDTCRQDLIKQFATEAEAHDDPEFFQSLECISEDISKSIAQLRMEMASLSKLANTKLKMLEGYRA